MSRGVGRIQRHMEYIANTIEAMLDILEIIQNLPAARNRDLVALLAIGCCHVAQQWERVVVLRLGRFNRVSGPGLFWTIPVIESNTMRVEA